MSEPSIESIYDEAKLLYKIAHALRGPRIITSAHALTENFLMLIRWLKEEKQPITWHSKEVATKILSKLDDFHMLLTDQLYKNELRGLSQEDINKLLSIDKGLRVYRNFIMKKYDLT